MYVHYITFAGRGYHAVTAKLIPHVGAPQCGASACTWLIPGTYQEDEQ